MTKPLLPIFFTAVTLTAAPAFAQHGHASRGHAAAHGHSVYVAPHGGYYAAPRYYRPYYYAPYYAFRPHFSIGFGVSVGYPVAYPAYAPYYYPAPYGYPPYAQTYPSQAYPYNYPQQGYPQNGYPQQGYPQNGYPQQSYPQNGSPQQQSYPYGNNSMQVPQPRSVSNAGGVSFEISPSDAAVFVDGSYVGTVDQFGPQTEPLKLTPGRHRIELRADGMQPMSFDATITAGQVIPYRGTLQPQ